MSEVDKVVKEVETSKKKGKSSGNVEVKGPDRSGAKKSTTIVNKNTRYDW